MARATADRKEIPEVLREKAPKDWVKTILAFEKKLNAIDENENEIKIEDRKGEPKVDEKKGKKHLKKKTAPKKIEKSEIIIKENKNTFEDEDRNQRVAISNIQTPASLLRATRGVLCFNISNSHNISSQRSVRLENPCHP